MSFISNLKVSSKLSFAFFSIVLLMGLLGAFSIERLSHLNDQTNFMLDMRLASVRDSLSMAETINRLRTIEYRLASTPKEQEAAVRQDIAKSLEIYAELDKGYSDSIGDATEQSIYDQAVERHKPFAASHARIEQLVADDKRAEALDYLNGEARQVYLALLEPLHGLAKHNETRANIEAKDTRATYANGVALIIGSLVFAVALAGLLAWLVSRSITVPLKAAMALTDAVANGDLTRSVDATGRDEMAQLMRALGSMRDGLVRIVAGMRGSSDSIATASAQIASGNANLSSRTEDTASNLQLAAASMKQLTDTIKSSADAAAQANQLAASASSIAERGGKRM